MAADKRPKENWNSRLGVILAVSGSAVGLGNFLRFPGEAAQYGGGAFMLAYFILFLLIGLPSIWTEWAMGRYGGQHGFHSPSGVFNAIVRHPSAKYLASIGFVIPVVIYMYYVNIEAWCLAYAVNFATGSMDFATAAESTSFFGSFTGAEGDGEGLGFSLQTILPYLIFAFALNFFLIYRGLNKGIEWFTNFAMPALFVLAFIILIRVLTLGAPDPAQPQNNVNNGLGFMWNPTKVFLEERSPNDASEPEWVQVKPLVGKNLIEAEQAVAADSENLRITRIPLTEQLLNPELWLAAAGQIFFSVSVGFGLIMTYSSYMKRDDDVVLSGLSAASANEFAEVGLGGLITLPAAVAFFGVSGLVGIGVGTFDLGFKALPLVFSQMPVGALFGFLFFFLLFLAAVTSSLSMLQAGIALLEEAMNIGRKQSVAILGALTAIGAGFVLFFSGDLKALDTLDFWVGTFLIFILATMQMVVFAWILGIDKGLAIANHGALLKIPPWVGFIMKWITPAILVTIFGLWVGVKMFGFNLAGGEQELSGYVRDLIFERNPVAWMSIGLIVVVLAFAIVTIASSPRYGDFLKSHHGTARDGYDPVETLKGKRP